MENNVTSVRLTQTSNGTELVGTLLTAGEETVGQSGVLKRWPQSVFTDAAVSSLEGVPLIHTHDETVRSTVGRVTRGWFDGERLRFRATIFDEELVEKIRNGLSSVSLAGKHAPVSELEETDSGAKIIEGLRFRHVALVTNPAAKSATVGVAPSTGVSPDETAPSASASAAALSIGDSSFALSGIGSIALSTDDGTTDDTMNTVQIEETTYSQLIELQNAGEFDDSTTMDELISHAAAEAGAPTDEQVKAEQSRLSQKFSDGEVSPGKDTDSTVELSEAERSEVKAEQERLRGLMDK
jgi:hypothetical protein